jgi:hypothetical protein
LLLAAAPRAVAAEEARPNLGAVVRLTRVAGELRLRYRVDADWSGLQRLATAHPERYRVSMRETSDFVAMTDERRYALHVPRSRDEIKLIGSVRYRGRLVSIHATAGGELRIAATNDGPSKLPSLESVARRAYRLTVGDQRIVGTIDDLLWSASHEMEEAMLPVLGELGLEVEPRRDDPLVARLVLKPPALADDEARRVGGWIEALGSSDFVRRQAAERELREAPASRAAIGRLVRAEIRGENLELRRRLGRILDARGRIAAAWRLIEAQGLAEDAEYLGELAASAPVEAIRSAARARRTDR